MLLRVKVKAKARKENLREIKSGVFEIFVREKAELGAANRAALALLARSLDIPIKKLSIVRGNDKPSKHILVRDGGKSIK